MIARVWRGWTAVPAADDYELLLRERVFPGIEAKRISGYRGIELFRAAPKDGEVEFLTLMRFDSIEAVRAFAGEDWEAAYVPQAAREILAHWDDRSSHYEMRERRGLL